MDPRKAKQLREHIRHVLYYRGCGSGSPLVAAVANGDVGQVAALLANGANPDETDNVDAWASALTIAVMAKNVEAVVLLVKAGANPHGPNDEEDPVFVAAVGGNVDVLNVLLAAPGASVAGPDKDFVFAAAQYGNAEAVSALLAAGADPNAIPSGTRTTPVSVAARNNYVDALAVLIAAGANVDTPNSGGSSPAYVAAQEGRAETLKLLIAAGADIETPRSTGARPLYIAAVHGHVDAVKVLIEAGADVHATAPDTKLGPRTPADSAMRNGHELVLKALLAAGAAPPSDFNAKEDEDIAHMLGKGFSLTIKQKKKQKKPTDGPQTPQRCFPLDARGMREVLHGWVDPDTTSD